MSFAYAFKNAAVAEYGDDIVAREFDAAIGRVTGGRFCHVEGVLDMTNIKAATCFSARQPHGVSIQEIDLSSNFITSSIPIGDWTSLAANSLWHIVTIPTVPSEDKLIYGYAMGASGKPYNTLGLLQVGFDVPITQPGAVFCSQVNFEGGVACFQSMSGFAKINPLHVAPSGKPRNGYGLFELITRQQTP